MASPDRIRNSQLFLLISAIPLYVWVKKTIPHAMTTTTTVQMAVARFELTPSIPILAKIEVSAANTADNNANTIHIEITCNCVFQALQPQHVDQQKPSQTVVGHNCHQIVDRGN